MTTITESWYWLEDPHGEHFAVWGTRDQVDLLAKVRSGHNRGELDDEEDILRAAKFGLDASEQLAAREEHLRATRDELKGDAGRYWHADPDTVRWIAEIDREIEELRA